MSNTLLISLAVLGILGGVLAVVLYFVAQRPVCLAPTVAAAVLQAAVPWPRLV